MIILIQKSLLQGKTTILMVKNKGRKEHKCGRFDVVDQGGGFSQTSLAGRRVYE
ncbi:hypothetical protein J43TS3_20410 [Ornithinibacillus bavariensis]|uniref:Uncharacterized protein n=1 Tax=Ornithinibacillus bavariensis TaxID=545502 RepID=A0A920C654_9BACI|nr:hypothetical protein J43TS3_20410 [Ornithinibacillus bavariensis]